ncbi:MAG: ATP-binding protein [Ignavibacteria bacterium]
MRFLRSVRGQLTFYFVLILAFILIIFSISLYNIFRVQAEDEIDKSMLLLAGSLKEEIQTDGFQKDILEEIKEVYIPYSVPNQQVLEILDRSGNSFLEFQSEPNINLELILKKEWISESLTEMHIYTTTSTSLSNENINQIEYRILLYPVRNNSQPYVLVVGIPMTILNNTLKTFRLIIFTAIPFFLILSALFGWFFSKRAYKPVRDLIKNTELISANNLKNRLPENNSGDEIAGLTNTLNEMISRLDNSFQNLKQFTSDASHELRTPLTILKGEIEVALLKQRTVAEYENVLKNNLEETERLYKIVEGLLILSQAESGRKDFAKEEIDLKELITDAVLKINILAAKKNVKIILSLDDKQINSDRVLIFGDKNLLLNVFINLLHNSIKYSSAGSEIICRETIDLTKKAVCISVKDSGIGISLSDQNYIFDRFSRADNSRTRELNSGSGLGLAIAKAVIHSHNGEISVNSVPDKGAEFVVSIPYII